jgi:hypothetical protein
LIVGFIEHGSPTGKLFRRGLQPVKLRFIRIIATGSLLGRAWPIVPIIAKITGGSSLPTGHCNAKGAVEGSEAVIWRSIKTGPAHGIH